jgi:hypothetical protein
MLYGPVTVNGILAVAGRYPFCMTHGIYRQFEHKRPYLEHIERHILEAEDGIGKLLCPHSRYEAREFVGSELRKHLEEVHYIRLSALH